MINGTSTSFKTLVSTLEQLPSIGRKSAMRLAYNLVIENRAVALNLSESIQDALSHVVLCRDCGGICEDEICSICSDTKRQNHEICIVAHPKDVITIEETKLFHGRYFIIESANSFRLNDLRRIINDYSIREIIFAYPPSATSDTLIIYIEDKLKDFNLFFTKIAQGIPFGVNLENVDQVSLFSAFRGRKQI